jgi:FMN reductase
MERRSGIVALVGNPRPGSRTAAVASSVAERFRLDGEPVDVVELADLGPALLDWSAQPEVEAALTAVAGCRLVVVATPTYKASYTGLLKAFFDRYSSGALRGTASVAVMVGAAAHHTLAVDAHLRPLLAELGSTCVAGIYVLESDLERLDEVLDEWVAGLALPVSPATA